MIRRFLIVLCVMALGPASAWGVQTVWPLRGTGLTVLGYNEAYTTAEGTSRTHHGVDVGAEPESDVVSCIDGTVTFAGRIPAGEGASTFAVTVRRDDGLLVTCLPLSEIAVTKGESVSRADDLGVLAETGDASSSAPHVHVSCRMGEDYVDPAGLLIPPGAPQATPEADATAIEPAGVTMAESGPALTEIPVDVELEVADSAQDPVSCGEAGVPSAVLPSGGSAAADAGSRAVDSATILDALGGYVARANEVCSAQPHTTRLARPDWNAAWLAAPLALAVLAQAGSRYVKTSLSTASRPGESEVAAAVGR